MEMRTYAESIFFSDTLEGKLLDPSKITDQTPGDPWHGTDLPHRPAGLAMEKPGIRKVAFPRISELEKNEKRGQVLHFFANHELLALELMALALMRFPDAPARWRKTLIATMKDEQKHLQFYRKQMTVLGVELGEAPLNRFFWDQISTMAKPLDFAARMSLTFEQANLDFSLFYRDAFTQVGDATSAAIMQDVLDDEVRHVAHGLRAFEQWRDPKKTLWEAYGDALPFPLTPARGKGGVLFSREHREKAGMPKDFIDRMQVYSHTRGRPPAVHVFNPGTESALGLHREGYTPNKHVLGFTKDLEILPLVLGSSDDVVLVRDLPEPGHLATLQEQGFSIPDFVKVPLEKQVIPADHTLLQRSFSDLLPWGWDPTIAEFLSPLEARINREFPPLRDKVAGQLELASKAWLAERAPNLLEALAPKDRDRCVSDSLPTVATDLSGALEAIAHHLAVGTGRVVLKAPIGTAGRDAIRIDTPEPEPNQQRWIETTLENQGALVVEAWYQRLVDLSLQFRVRPDRTLAIDGLTRFFTDVRGQYRGTLVGPPGAGLPAAVRRFLLETKGKEPWALAALKTFAKGLLPDLVSRGFQGRAGIDAMVVRLPDGSLKLRAPLELNPRPTMGHVALGVAKPWGSRATVLWTFLGQPELKQTGETRLPALLKRLEEALPTQEGDKPGTPPIQGVFPLNNPETARHVLGVALVSQSLAVLDSALTQAEITIP